MPLRIRWRVLGGRAVVVESVARELFGPSRIEGDVEQLRAVAIAAEHVGRDEARSGEVALVAEDAIELQRVADRFMDLQHHLVGREQRVHPARRAIRRGEELESFFGDPAAAVGEAEAVEDLDAALLADAAMAVQRAPLGDAVGVRGHGERREHEAEALQDVAARAGDQALPRVADLDQRLPVDDARVAAGLARDVAQEVEPFGARWQRRIDGRRRVVAARRGSRQGTRIGDCVAGRRARPVGRAGQRLAQAGGRGVGGGGIAIAAVGIDRGHHSAVGGQREGLRDVLADAERLSGFLDEAQRPEVGAEVERGQGAGQEGHGVRGSGVGEHNWPPGATGEAARKGREHRL